VVDVGLAPDVGGAHLSDGFQFTRWLQMANPRKIPSIIISGSNKPAFKRQAKAAGADTFLAKPIENESLLNSIESALTHSTPAAVESAALTMATGTSGD
jgi:CheY-like chemotaxis protein